VTHKDEDLQGGSGESFSPDPLPERTRVLVISSILKWTKGWTGIGLVLLVLIVALAIVKPEFRASANLWNILRANSVLIIIVCGSTFVLLSQGIDLSVGSMVALLTMFMGLALTNSWPGLVAVPAIVFAGVLLGLFNGILIGKVKVNFFVVTLGTLMMFRSAALLTTNGATITLFTVDEFEAVRTLGDGSIGPVPVPPIIAAMVFLISWAVLKWSVFGRTIYAVGNNPEAARLAGIRVDRIRVLVYTVCGLTVGIAAVVLTGRISSASPTVGTGIEMQAIAAVLLGGVSFSGGAGSIVGALVGALLLAVINNGLDLLSISSFIQGIVTGAILIFAVYLDRVRQASQ
jgi:ribose/xylose/arabinose/galactoside ABC-type transport system permease subunit